MTMQTCEPKSVDLYFWKTVAQAWWQAVPAEPKGCEPTAPVKEVVETKPFVPTAPASTQQTTRTMQTARTTMPTPVPKAPAPAAPAAPTRPERTTSVLDKVSRGFVTVTESLCTQAVEIDDDDEDVLADLGLS